MISWHVVSCPMLLVATGMKKIFTQHYDQTSAWPNLSPG